METGEVLWNLDMGSFGTPGIGISSPPYVFEDYVVFLGTTDWWVSHSIVYLDKHTGEFLGWDWLPGEFNMVENICGSGRSLYLEALGAYVEVLLEPEFPAQKQKNVKDYRLIYLPPASQGVNRSGTGGTPLVQGGKIFLLYLPDRARDEGSWIAPWLQPEPYRSSPRQEWYTGVSSLVVCLDQATLDVLWTHESHGFESMSGNRPFRMVDQGLLCTDDAGYRLLNPDTGETLWSAQEWGWPFQSGYGRGYEVVGNAVYQTSYAYDEPERIVSPPEYEEFTVSRFEIIPGQRPKITWGWVKSDRFPVGCNPIVKDGILYLMGQDGLYLFEASTGRHLGIDPRIHTDFTTMTQDYILRYKDTLIVPISLPEFHYAAVKLNYRIGADGGLYKE